LPYFERSVLAPTTAKGPEPRKDWMRSLMDVGTIASERVLLLD
jgi:hypothetical protein